MSEQKDPKKKGFLARLIEKLDKSLEAKAKKAPCCCKGDEKKGSSCC